MNTISRHPRHNTHTTLSTTNKSPCAHTHAHPCESCVGGRKKGVLDRSSRNVWTHIRRLKWRQQNTSSKYYNKGNDCEGLVAYRPTAYHARLMNRRNDFSLRTVESTPRTPPNQKQMENEYFVCGTFLPLRGQLYFSYSKHFARSIHVMSECGRACQACAPSCAWLLPVSTHALLRMVTAGKPPPFPPRPS